jgi:CrcB protein
MMYLWVALGSALGGVARYGGGLLAARVWGEAFPWGTIAINVLGSFVIGFFGALTMPGGAAPAGAGLRVFVMVGICGGFTTFSSFSLQTLMLAREGAWTGAVGNVVLSVVLCLAAVTAGHGAAERLGIAHAARGGFAGEVVAAIETPTEARAVLAAAGMAAERWGRTRLAVLTPGAGFMPTEEIRADAGALGDAVEESLRGWRARGWRAEQVAGDPAALVGRARRAAVIVLSAGATGGGGDIRAALSVARRPVLLVPDAADAALGAHVAVAWRADAAAAHALSAALPLLRGAARVTLLAGAGDGETGRRQLARMGVPAEIDRNADDAAMRARAIGADTLVAGDAMAAGAPAGLAVFTRA